MERVIVIIISLFFFFFLDDRFVVDYRVAKATRLGLRLNPVNLQRHLSSIPMMARHRSQLERYAFATRLKERWIRPLRELEIHSRIRRTI